MATIRPWKPVAEGLAVAGPFGRPKRYAPFLIVCAQPDAISPTFIALTPLCGSSGAHRRNEDRC